MNATDGLSGAARRVAYYARSLVKLELELAASEIKQKLTARGRHRPRRRRAAGAVVFALAFGLAAIAAAVATTMSVWAALLVDRSRRPADAVRQGAVLRAADDRLRRREAEGIAKRDVNTLGC